MLMPASCIATCSLSIWMDDYMCLFDFLFMHTCEINVHNVTIRNVHSNWFNSPEREIEFCSKGRQHSPQEPNQVQHTAPLVHTHRYSNYAYIFFPLFHIFVYQARQIFYLIYNKYCLIWSKHTHRHTFCKTTNPLWGPHRDKGAPACYFRCVVLFGLWESGMTFEHRFYKDTLKVWKWKWVAGAVRISHLNDNQGQLSP